MLPSVRCADDCAILFFSKGAPKCGVPGSYALRIRPLQNILNASIAEGGGSVVLPDVIWPVGVARVCLGVGCWARGGGGGGAGTWGTAGCDADATAMGVESA